MTKSKIVLISLMLLFLNACSSYKIGNITHPQLKTVAIGKITNSTDEPRLAFYIKSKLKETFLLDSSLKLVPLDKADIIVSGNVDNYRIRSISSAGRFSRENENGFQASVFRARMTFSYEIKTRNHWEVQKGRVTGSARYSEFLDQQQEKINALERASVEASKELVVNITEGW